MSTNRYFEESGLWPRNPQAVFRAYVAGFILSIALTFLAYWVATHHALTMPGMLFALGALAIIQAAVQLLCFLHMSKEGSWRERLLISGAIGIVIFILVVGSIWIMSTLNSRMMPSQIQMDQYMQDQDGI